MHGLQNANYVFVFLGQKRLNDKGRMKAEN